jgi:hypothetical protein
VDNQIFDPCLIGADGASLVCGMDPTGGEPGFQLMLSEPLPEPDVAAATTPETGERLSREALANASYRSDWPAAGVAALSGGAYREKYDDASASELVITLTDIIAYGDLNGDGVEDAAVVLVTNAGGSGNFYDLAVVLNEAGQPNSVASTFLGDRVVIDKLDIQGGQVVIELITQGPDDPMCCPTIPVMLSFALNEANNLVLSGKNAWWVQLADGVTCNFMTGATLVFEEKRINYACSDGSNILGELTPGVVWTAEKVTLENSANGFVISDSQLVDISTVWQPVNPAEIMDKIGLSPAEVSIDPGDATGTMSGQIWPATPYRTDIAPAFNGEPAHLRFVFNQNDLPATTGVEPGAPHLSIYPVENYRTMYETAGVTEIGERIERLQSLLADRPATIEAEIPVLPDMGAVQTIHAQEQYLDFQGGSGIRFITQYAQDAGPILSGQIFYTFQGLTSDGQYYVAYFQPVTTPALPASYEESAAAEDYDAFVANLDRYLEETTQTLNALPTTEFTPDLAQLDRMIQSLTIRP